MGTHQELIRRFFKLATPPLQCKFIAIMVYELALWTRHSRHSDASVIVSDGHESQSVRLCSIAVRRRTEMTDSHNHTLSLSACLCSSAPRDASVRHRQWRPRPVSAKQQRRVVCAVKLLGGWDHIDDGLTSRHVHHSLSDASERAGVGVVTRDL
ncbi:hypothetical protein NDU88_002173 [Pleurodeles waltl]|uniref:Uncharacterized protein n=1 Tax=Pleurodeles waltl TaxID=8319 RepID=A0AAV7WP48_PLEWA|nr:hypothetical protein NDU88_002173 [Pleurodeles waltl]